jgi:hypothetical protein
MYWDLPGFEMEIKPEVWQHPSLIQSSVLRGFQKERDRSRPDSRNTSVAMGAGPFAEVIVKNMESCSFHQ